MLLFCCGFYILTSLVSFLVALNQINFHVVNNKRLLSGSIATTSVRSALVCAAMCTFDQRCCSSNYEKGSKLCRLETSCSQGMKQFQNSQVMIKVLNWIPVFVAFGGNGRPIYPAWTIQTECDDLPTPLDISVTTRHLRNPLMDRWSDVGVKKVKVQLFTNDVQVVWMLFNGENTNEMDWFSKENLLNSSFNDLTTSSTTNFFGIDGERYRDVIFFSETSACDNSKELAVIRCSVLQYFDCLKTMYKYPATFGIFKDDFLSIGIMVIVLRIVDGSLFKGNFKRVHGSEKDVHRFFFIPKMTYQEIGILTKRAFGVQILNPGVYDEFIDNQTVVNWLPVFVAYSGNEQSVYTAWTNQEECDDLRIPLDISVTTKHLRNPLIDRWSDVIIRKVKVELLKNNTAVVWIIFNGENTNYMNWFRKENLLNSSFDDLTTSSATNFFDITGDWGRERQFFINRNYGSCATGGGWFVVSGKRQDCAWEKKGVYPVFLYTKNGFNRNWHTGSAEPADRMIISVGI